MKTMLETLLAETKDVDNTSSSDHLSKLNCLIQQHLGEES